MVDVGQQLTLTIDGLAGTAGIGRVDGFAVMVDGALPGETVRATVIKAGKRYATAGLDSVVTASPHRVDAPCPHYGACGGCQLQHLSYDQQLLAKQQQVSDALARIGGFANPQVLPTLGMDQPWRYRNKGVFPVSKGEDGGIKIGFYAASSHDLIDIQDCLLQHPNAAQAAAGLRQAMAQIGITAYDEGSHTGLMRHLMVRTSSIDYSAMAVLCINGQKLPDESRLCAILREACPALTAILVSPNTQRTSIALGDSVRLLWGKPVLQDELMGSDFAVSPHSFFQVNPKQTQVLYQTALDYAALQGDETVLDLYCGAGTISLALARRAKQVIGVEVVQAAIDDANAAAKANGIANASFFAGDVAKELPRIAKQLARRGQRVDVAVIDPPRKGCDASVLQALAALAPQRIVYVSCDPATQARDAKLLAQAGYGLVRAQPVDMFCQTGHCESIVLLQRKDE